MVTVLRTRIMQNSHKHSHSILQVTVIDKWIALEFPLATSEQATLMRLTTFPYGYPGESERIFATRYRSVATIPAPRSPRSDKFCINLNFLTSLAMQQ